MSAYCVPRTLRHEGGDVRKEGRARKEGYLRRSASPPRGERWEFRGQLYAASPRQFTFYFITLFELSMTRDLSLLD